MATIKPLGFAPSSAAKQVSEAPAGGGGGGAVAATDPFMRKNQVWFQKSLPPSIEPLRKRQKQKNHTERMALNVLNPKSIDRRLLSPTHYKQRLNELEGLLHRSSNQLPESGAVAALLLQEKTLINLFNDNRLTSVPC